MSPPHAATAPNSVRFAAFRIDLAAERLWNGSDPVTLRPKTWQVLRLLVEKAGQLVTKDELLDTIWRDVNVEEKAVNTCIGEIRAALGDSSRHPRFVETVQRRGFRFVGGSPAATALRNDTPRAAIFVGRSSELEALAARLDESAGNATLTVVRGAAGIGKTRLVREAIQRTGRRALVGQCIEDGGLPYLPWVEMIHQQLRSRPSPETGELPMAAELERLIPGLQADAATALQASSDPELARIRLFEALAAFFDEASRGDAPLLVLEDLHWADAASLRALQALLPRLGGSTQVVATLRDEDAGRGSPVRAALEALRRRGLVSEITLAGLAPDEMRELVAGIAGSTVPAAVVTRITEGSEGSPFFIEEILRHYATTTSKSEDPAELFLPDNVIEIFERRLRQLSPAARRVADAVALCGHDADEALLEHALAMTDLELATAVSEAIEQEVLCEQRERPGRYAFVHALMSPAISQRLAAPLRRALHARLAEASAATRADATERSAAVARHLVLAMPAVPVERAIDALVEASEQAGRGLAYEESITHLARAVELSRSAVAGSMAHGRLTELCVRHAEALQKIADAETVAAAFREAAALAREAGEAEWQARAALGMATIWDFEAPDLRGHLEDALLRLGDGHPALRARLLARLSVALYPLPGTRSRCEALSSEAAALARRVGDATLLAQTLTDWLAGQWYTDNLPAQDAVSQELLSVAETSGDAALVATAHGWRVVIALCRGDIDGAESHGLALRDLAGRLGQPLYRWCGLYLGATLTLLRGELAAAEALANEAFEYGRLASPQSATIVYFTQMVTIRREQDRIGELLPLLEQNPARMSNDSLAWNMPHFYLEADRLDDGAAAFDRAWSTGLAAMPGQNSRNRRALALGAMSLACAALERREQAAVLYEIVAPEADRWAVSGFGAVSYGLVGNAAGALAICLGHYDAAALHFDRAIAEYERRGIPVPLARALVFYADLRLRRGASGDVAEAGRLLDRAAALAERHDLARVTVLLRRVRERFTL